jgi:hypothetical protein
VQVGQSLFSHQADAISAGPVRNVHGFGYILEFHVGVTFHKRHLVLTLLINVLEPGFQSVQETSSWLILKVGGLLASTLFNCMTIGDSGGFAALSGLGCGTSVFSPILCSGRITIKIISKTRSTSINGVTLISDERVLRAPTIIDMAWLLELEPRWRSLLSFARFTN